MKNPIQDIELRGCGSDFATLEIPNRIRRETTQRVELRLGEFAFGCAQPNKFGATFGAQGAMRRLWRTVLAFCCGRCGGGAGGGNRGGRGRAGLTDCTGGTNGHGAPILMTHGGGVRSTEQQTDAINFYIRPF